MEMQELKDGETYYYVDGFRCDEFGNERDKGSEVISDVFDNLKEAKKVCTWEINLHNANARVNECVVNKCYGQIELIDKAYHTPLIDGGWDVDKIDEIL